MYCLLLDIMLNNSCTVTVALPNICRGAWRKDGFWREFRNSNFHRHHPLSKADNYCRHDSLLHVLSLTIQSRVVTTCGDLRWSEMKTIYCYNLQYSIAWTECACRLYMHNNCQLASVHFAHLKQDLSCIFI